MSSTQTCSKCSLSKPIEFFQRQSTARVNKILTLKTCQPCCAYRVNFVLSWFFMLIATRIKIIVTGNYRQLHLPPLYILSMPKSHLPPLYILPMSKSSMNLPSSQMTIISPIMKILLILLIFLMMNTMILNLPNWWMESTLPMVQVQQHLALRLLLLSIVEKSPDKYNVECSPTHFKMQHQQLRLLVKKFYREQTKNIGV